MSRIRFLALPLLLVLSLAVPAIAQGAPPAPGAQRLKLVIPLVANDAGLRSFAHAVSTPGSGLYGQYEPVPLLAQRFGATAPVRAAAAEFLRRAGATGVSVNQTDLFAEATMTVRTAERVFGVDLRQYGGSAGTPRFVAPSLAAHASGAGVPLPAGLRGVATGVVGLDTRGLGRTSAATRASTGAGRASDYNRRTGTASGCASGLGTGGFTPNQYDTAYGISALRAAGLSGQGERLALIEVDDFKRSDIKTFGSCFGLSLPPLSTYVADTKQHVPLGGEATLDLETAIAAAPKLAGIDVYESNGDAAEVDRQFVAPLLQPGVKPQVISASLSLCEPDMLQAFGHSGINSVERDIDLAAAAGITLVASSGDDGSSACTDDKDNPLPSLSVNYPASSPSVTAVGGTNITLDANNSITSQQVWNDGSDQLAAGGGGLSMLFKRPSYQNGVVSQATRVLPDVALLADLLPGYAVYCTAAGNSDCKGFDSPWHSVGGTSAAGPLFAAGALLVDQDLDRVGRAQLGLLNPLLYAIGTSSNSGAVFSDVVSGDNDLGPYIPGHAAALGCCSAGTGFDLATGWGGVNFTSLDLVARQALPAFGKVSISIPRGQRPLRTGSLTLKLGCSQSCTVSGFGVIFSSSRFNVTSAKHTLSGRGTVSAVIRFSSSQLRSLRSALAHHLAPDGEFYAVGLAANGTVAKTTSGLDILLRN